jgi:hypothetical protein
MFYNQFKKTNSFSQEREISLNRYSYQKDLNK